MIVKISSPIVCDGLVCKLIHRPSMENRLNLTKDVLRKLFALSGNECAFPDCSERMILEDGTYIGQICHIEAAKPGGQRYNENQTEEERRDFDNLLVMCYKHHKITDDVTIYTIERLKQIKKDHEDRFRNIPRAVNDIFITGAISIELEEFDKLYGLTEETNRNVKEIKTPTAYNGSSAIASPLKIMISNAAIRVRTVIPLE